MQNLEQDFSSWGLTPKQDYLLELQKRKRIEYFRTRFKEFCFFYFSHVFYANPSIMHEDLFSEVQEAINNNKPDSLAFAAPRGTAKSSIISFALPVWAAVYEKKHYIIIVSDTADQANDFLNNIKSEFEDNEKILLDFGNLQGLVWTNSDIILSSDIRIQALGAGKKIRGRRYKQYRPDLIIGDDLENDENIASVDQRKKMYSWQTKALSKAGDERTDKIFIGTIMHYDSLLNKLLKNPTYLTRKYQSVIKWSDSSLWDQWEKIIVNLDDKNRLVNAEQFFLTNKSEMLRDTQVLWDSKENYYNLMLQKVADGPAAFASEKQNEPLDEDARRFSQNWIQYYEDSDIVGKKLIVVGFVDPSMGKKGGDYSAIIVLGEDENLNVYVLVADIQRRHPDIICSDVIGNFLKYRFTNFGVEENQFQEYFKDTLTNKIKEYNENNKTAIDVVVKGVRQHSDKILRIQSLQPDIKNGRIKFKRSQQTLIEQLVNFPAADNDDGPDALEGAMFMLGKRSALADFYQQKAYESSRQNKNSILQNFGLQGIIK